MRRVSWASTRRVSRSRVLFRRPLDGLPGDLAEHHPAHRHLGLEDLQQVPGDGLALAVLIGREESSSESLSARLSSVDAPLLVGVDDVIGGETGVDVDGELPVRALLHFRRQLGGVRQVADVAGGRLDGESIAQIGGDVLDLVRRLDDDEPAPGASCHVAPVLFCRHVRRIRRRLDVEVPDTIRRAPRRPAGSRTRGSPRRGHSSSPSRGRRSPARCRPEPSYAVLFVDASSTFL